jgi:cytochrome c oxidase subunit 1
LLAFVIMLTAFFVPGGASLAGWTQYVPLSALPAAGPGQGLGTDLWLVSIALFCVGSAMTAINFVTTTLTMRIRGMSLLRMPLTCWAWFVTAAISISAFGILFAGVILLLMERNLGTSIFVPSGLMVAGRLVDHDGGSPLLWQHLFWFFGHPEVYIAILPGMGVTSHLLSTFARKPVFGYRAMVYALIAIAALGFAIWGHHMFTTGMSPHSAFMFSSLTLAVGVPSAVKTFNWLATLWRGKIRLTVPMLFAIGFVSLFVTGGLTGPILAQPVLDSYLHDTYFVVAHFHLIMGLAAVFGIFASTYFWFPRIFGRLMNEQLGRAHFWLTFVCAYATFMPMHLLGMAGHPRRYSQLTGVQFLQPMISLQRFITVAALITAGAQIIFLVNLFWSMRRGTVASNNPWHATSLEWQPEAYNLQVNHGPYEYSVPGAPRDFIAQTDPPLDGQK